MSASLPLGVPSLAPKLIGGLAVRRLGTGFPLVLVHGGVGSWTHWNANVVSLSRHFSLTLIDLPGYGDAPMPSTDEPDPYIEGVASDLSRAMKGLGAFGVVGFSFGAVICAGAARRLGALVNAMSLLGPAGFGVPAGRRVDLVSVPPAAENPAGHRAAVAHNLGQFMLSKVPAPDDVTVDLHSANMARLRFDSRKVSFQDRIVEDLGALSCPVQVIWGENDHLPVPSTQARADRIRRARPDVEIHIVPGGGHWVQYEAAHAVDALLIAFHERVSRSSLQRGVSR